MNDGMGQIIPTKAAPPVPRHAAYYAPPPPVKPPPPPSSPALEARLAELETRLAQVELGQGIAPQDDRLDRLERRMERVEGASRWFTGQVATGHTAAVFASLPSSFEPTPPVLVRAEAGRTLRLSHPQRVVKGSDGEERYYNACQVVDRTANVKEGWVEIYNKTQNRILVGRWSALPLDDRGPAVATIEPPSE
jgi:hypothetical protein